MRNAPTNENPAPQIKSVACCVSPEVVSPTCRGCWNLERRATWAAAAALAEVWGNDAADWLDNAEAAIGAYHAVLRPALTDGPDPVEEEEEAIVRAFLGLPPGAALTDGADRG